ncbi:hypothetical protein LguiB_004129 [Lonicera macranthoides]
MACQILNHLEPWSDLRGMVVLVTGASSGLGREFCVDLAKAGCRVVAAARRTDRLKSLCDEINRCDISRSLMGDDPRVDSSAPLAIAVELDITGEAKAIKDSVDKAWAAFGHIDTLVNNAGIRGTVNNSLDLPEEEWENVIRTNLTGTWLVSKYVGAYMRSAGKGGSIINISSVSGLNRPQFCGGVGYSSSKAAMDSMTKIMALELGVHKIRVNSIAPGIFRSEITKDLLEKDWFQNVASRIIPLKTFGTSDPALTSLVRYLMHDSSKYITGNIFIVDAGFTLPGFPIFSAL